MLVFLCICFSTRSREKEGRVKGQQSTRVPEPKFLHSQNDYWPSQVGPQQGSRGHTKAIDLVRFSSKGKPSSLIKEGRRRESRVLMMEHKLRSALPRRSVLLELMLALPV